MRSCQDCNKPDNPVTNQDGEVVHEVRKFDVLILQPELTPQNELPARWRMKRWWLSKDGGDYFRSKYLCRDCINRDYEKDKRRKEYSDLCKKARGENNMTYAQMITLNSGS